jgi:hypothetical protein
VADFGNSKAAAFEVRAVRHSELYYRLAPPGIHFILSICILNIC